MAVNRIKRIWKNAIPLNVAWQHFARKDLLTKLAAMPEFSDALKTEAQASGIMDSIIKISRAHVASQARKLVIDEMREQLLDELFNSNFSAFGYRLTPSESRGPVQIDPVFFEYPEIDWEGNSAEFNGKSYRAIGIIDPYNLPNPDRLKTGRPSSGDAINAAIKELIQKNPQFCDQHRAAACQQIRNTIGKPEIPGNGLSDKNLEKYIIANCGRRQIIK